MHGEVVFFVFVFTGNQWTLSQLSLSKVVVEGFLSSSSFSSPPPPFSLSLSLSLSLVRERVLAVTDTQYMYTNIITVAVFSLCSRNTSLRNL